jgi:hypothetical protein
MALECSCYVPYLDSLGREELPGPTMQFDYRLSGTIASAHRAADPVIQPTGEIDLNPTCYFR